MPKDDRKRRALLFAAGALLGAVLFFLVFGLSALNPCNDSFCLGGYIEKDIQQHYAGWLFYRQSTPGWPLGIAQGINAPDGVSVAYTDSIPLFAVLFRGFEAVLPATFQYFGLFTLLCYALQGGFGALLCGLFVNDYARPLCGAALFAASPVLLERAFRHTSLGAQFLVLAALYYYFRARRENRYAWPGLFLLNILAIGVHPYFLPMTYAVTLAMLLDHILRSRRWQGPVLYLAADLAGTVLLGWSLGLFYGNATSGGQSLYGYFGMNLNALWNPTSRWSTVWSRVLPVQNQTGGNYDAFNYLGLGVLLAGIVLLVWSAVHWRQTLALWRRHWALVLVCLCLTVFAVSNVVTANGATLFTLPLPHALVRLATTFRSSGRLFWPVYYLIFLSCLVFLLRRLPSVRWAALGLAALAAVQLWDISPALLTRSREMRQYQTEYQTPLISAFWQQAAGQYQHILSLDGLQKEPLFLALWAADNGLTTNDPFAARWDEAALAAQRQQQIDSLLAGQPQEGCLYLVQDEGLFLQLAEVLQDQALCAKLDDTWYIIAPGMNYDGGDVQRYGDAYPLRICDYTDSLWDHGVLTREAPYQTVLFYDCAFTRRRLEGMQALRADGVDYPILNIDDKDAGWLMVTLDIPDAHTLQGKELESIA